MQNKKIIIAGGTGFIGQEICNFFGAQNQLVILTRQLPNQQSNAFGENNLNPEVIKNIRYVNWDGENMGAWATEFEEAAMVINLAGKTVNCRYTEKNKAAIFESRIRSTKLIGQAILQATHPPELWINAASATIYPNASNEPRDEYFTYFADDFSVQVCK